jgi:hypothetical protein
VEGCDAVSVRSGGSSKGHGRHAAQKYQPWKGAPIHDCLGKCPSRAIERDFPGICGQAGCVGSFPSCHQDGSLARASCLPSDRRRPGLAELGSRPPGRCGRTADV